MRSSKTSRSRSTVILLALAIFVVINGIAFLIYSRITAEEPEVTAVAPQNGAEQLVIEGKINRLRKQAIDHLVDDEYQEAVTLLSTALQLSSGDAQGDLPQLLNLAKQQLQDTSNEPTAVLPAVADVDVDGDNTAPTAPDPEPNRVASTQERASKERATKERASRNKTRDLGRGGRATRSNPKPQPVDVLPKKPSMGTLAVMSTPPTAFTVDGAVAGITPKEVPVTAGTSHTISFLHKGKSLARRSSSVAEGKIAFVNVDLSNQIAELERAALVAATPKPEPITPPTVSTPKPALSKPALPTPAPTSRATGELSVVSPNLFGEIYVNGKSYGKPPRVIKGLPVGPVRVQIRVQGKARRAKMAKVVEGKRAKLRFR